MKGPYQIAFAGFNGTLWHVKSIIMHNPPYSLRELCMSQVNVITPAATVLRPLYNQSSSNGLSFRSEA